MITTNISLSMFRRRCLASMLVLFGLVSSLFSQDIGWEDMTRGKMWVRMYSSSGVGDIHGSGDAYRYDYPGFTEGADIWSSYGFVEWAGFMLWAEVDGVGTPFRILNAYTPNSDKVTANTNVAIIKNYNLVDASNPAEETVTGALNLLDYGILMQFKAMVWSYPMYDDFVIQEYTFINTGTSELIDFRFAPTAELVISMFGGYKDDDYYEWDIDHQAFYFHDGREWDANLGQYVDFDYGLTNNDRGDPQDWEAPNSITHEFASPGYFTLYWLDKPEQSDPANPENDHMNIVDKQNLLQHSGRTQDDPDNVTPEIGRDSDAYFLSSMKYDQPPPLTLEDGTALDAADAFATPRARGDNEYRIDYLYSTGPYTLAPGDSLKFVMAVVGGMMDYSYVAAGGIDGEGHLEEGADSLWANVEAAVELYARGYDMPHPPPTPSFMGNEGSNSILVQGVSGGNSVQWDPIPSSYTDPDYGENDVAGYRVYRSTFKSVGPWTMVKQIPVADVDANTVNGLLTYIDADASLGVGYYYGVTSYDTGHNTPWAGDPINVTMLPSLESGLVNGNSDPSYAQAQTSDDLNDIRVYPNPFKQHSGLLGSGEASRLEFVNIPAICTIRIYTLAGDLVRKIEHDDGSGDESWGSIALGDYQVSQYLQFVAPGIYLFHVESHVDGHEGESKVGKFVIIK